jgi:hypothetical protein
MLLQPNQQLQFPTHSSRSLTKSTLDTALRPILLDRFSSPSLVLSFGQTHHALHKLVFSLLSLCKEGVVLGYISPHVPRSANRLTPKWLCIGRRHRVMLLRLRLQASAWARNVSHSLLVSQFAIPRWCCAYIITSAAHSRSLRAFPLLMKKVNMSPTPAKYATLLAFAIASVVPQTYSPL